MIHEYWALSNSGMFCTILSYSSSGRSGPGPSGLVRKILVVQSGPEGPQFSRSVGTLLEWFLNKQYGSKAL